MRQIIESNKTLLVEGPTSVKVESGRAEVFCCPLKENQRVLVREGKRLPFFAVEKTAFEVSLGANGAVEEAAENTIPTSWKQPLESLAVSPKKPAVVLVLGKADSGKSSYCTYLVNNLVGGKRRVAVLDGDIGQSDIGPSGTVGYALTDKPVTELYELRLENAFFVGVTSPINALERTIEGLAAMKAEIVKKPVDFLVVNTDGWVQGDIAVRYKTDLVEKLEPDIVVGVQAEDELAELMANLTQQSFTVEVSSALSPRQAEKRKNLREMTYARYLKNAKLQIYPLSQMVLEANGGLPKDQEPEKGVLVGLYGYGDRFLGVGVLREINHARKALKVETAVPSKPARLVIGKIYLDKKLREISD